MLPADHALRLPAGPGRLRDGRHRPAAAHAGPDGGADVQLARAGAGDVWDPGELGGAGVRGGADERAGRGGGPVRVGGGGGGGAAGAGRVRGRVQVCVGGVGLGGESEGVVRYGEWAGLAAGGGEGIVGMDGWMDGLFLKGDL